ncbi:MAG TPA: phosphoadenosine phosphosulfate reductase family protein, partial [Agriterribacter sp.]|nr:phosphoadenosine phosphosulfate reductase family protein [Agriterribacter sp.]
MIEAAALLKAVQDKPLPLAIAAVADLFPGQVSFSSSLGQEDQVITDAIYRNNLPVRIFTLDTGRLFAETYELLERTSARY